MATLQSVDELLDKVIAELETLGELSNTLVVLTSDNGFLLGPHRFNRGKGAPYEEAVRVPLFVRGPSVAAGAVRREMVTNLDFAPSPHEWSDLVAPEPPRGRRAGRPRLHAGASRPVSSGSSRAVQETSGRIIQSEYRAAS